MGEAAYDFATVKHSESVCGHKFAQAVERSYGNSMREVIAGIEQSATLQIDEAEAVSLALEYAALLNRQPTLYLDVSSFLPILPHNFEDFMRPLLLSLAARAPTLRVIPVQHAENGYVSALDPVLRSALLPHSDHAKEPIRLKSIDCLVSLRAEDSNFARTAARCSGARFWHLDESDLSGQQAAAAILKLINRQCGGQIIEVANNRTNLKAAVTVTVNANAQRQDKKVQRQGKGRRKRSLESLAIADAKR